VSSFCTFWCKEGGVVLRDRGPEGLTDKVGLVTGGSAGDWSGDKGGKGNNGRMGRGNGRKGAGADSRGGEMGVRSCGVKD